MTRRFGVIAVERSAGATALGALVAEGRQISATGRRVVIYPEGTRVRIGQAPPLAMRHLVAALMLPAVILVVASYIRGRIYTTLKHPMLAGVKLWAAAHLIANGDLGSIILFGSFLAWAVFDRISLKRRADPGAPPMILEYCRNVGAPV